MQRWFLWFLIALMLVTPSACKSRDKTVDITFTCDVQGATLYVNGREQGVLPLTIPIPLGNNELEVRPPAGLEDILFTWQRELQVTEDSKQFDVVLLFDVDAVGDDPAALFEGVGGMFAGPGKNVFWTRDGHLLFTTGSNLRWIAKGFTESRIVSVGNIDWYWARNKRAYCLVDSTYYLVDFADGTKTELPYTTMFGDRVSRYIAGVTAENTIEVLLDDREITIEPDSGAVKDVLADPLGQHVVYRTANGNSHGVYLYILSEERAVPVVELNNAPYGLEFALSGNYYAFYSDEGLWLRPVDMSEYDRNSDWEGWLLTDEGIHDSTLIWLDWQPSGIRQESGYIVGREKFGLIEVFLTGGTSVDRSDAFRYFPEGFFQDLIRYSICIDNIENGVSELYRYQMLSYGGVDKKTEFGFRFKNVYLGDWTVSPCNDFVAYSERSAEGNRNIRIYSLENMDQIGNRLYEEATQ